MKLFPRSIVLLIAGITASAAVCADFASGLRERKVDVGEGVLLRVIEAGQAGPGPTLVFVPGWSNGADIWRQQIDCFAANHRVIAFDPRSQGQSTITTSGNMPEMRAQDLHNLLERLGARRPVLIGWSQGVQDLAAYIERYDTQDLAGLVLVDAAGRRWRGWRHRAAAGERRAIADARALSSASAGLFAWDDGRHYHQAAAREHDRSPCHHWHENAAQYRNRNAGRGSFWREPYRCVEKD